MKEIMTKNGYEKISQEIKLIKTVKIKEITIEIEAALEHGDLKENAEYHSAKENLDNLGRKLEELGVILANANIVDPTEYEHNTIKFGSTFTIEDEDTEEEVTYTVVGNTESDLDKGLISMNSPLMKQLMGESEGGSLTIKLPNGEKDYEVIKVWFDGSKFE